MTDETRIKPLLKLDFCDFGGLNKNDNWFVKLLSARYEVEINDKPDLLIFQEGGHMNRLYSCKKLFWTGESIQPDWRTTDYAMTCHHIDRPEHFRFPYYVFGSEATAQDLIRQPDEAEMIMAENRKFCCAVISNGNRKRAGYRIDFFEKLSQYKQVDSGGRWGNNIGGPLPLGGQAKHRFLKQYKFNLCFENKSMPGYVTEKLTEAMWARCIPIYWGAPDVGNEFNTKSMLCRHDYADDDSFIKRIIEVDQNDDLYREILQQPYFLDNRPNPHFDLSRMLAFFDGIIQDTRKPVSQTLVPWHRSRWRLAKRAHF